MKITKTDWSKDENLSHRSFFKLNDHSRSPKRDHYP